MLHPDNLFHVGIAVRDLDISAAALSAAGACVFHPLIQVDHQVQTADGEATVHFAVRYSTGPFRFELIKEVAGTIWTASERSLHHLGYWAQDLERSIAGLTEQGLPVTARTAWWSLHRTPDGYYIELLDEIRRPDLEARWAAAENSLVGGDSG